MDSRSVQRSRTAPVCTGGARQAAGGSNSQSRSRSSVSPRSRSPPDGVAYPFLGCIKGTDASRAAEETSPGMRNHGGIFSTGIPTERTATTAQLRRGHEASERPVRRQQGRAAQATGSSSHRTSAITISTFCLHRLRLLMTGRPWQATAAPARHDHTANRREASATNFRTDSMIVVQGGSRTSGPSRSS